MQGKSYILYNSPIYTRKMWIGPHKCRPLHILFCIYTAFRVDRSTSSCYSALALRPAHISYCIYTQLLRALYIFAHYTHARGRTSDWRFSRQNVLEWNNLYRKHCLDYLVMGVLAAFHLKIIWTWRPCGSIAQPYRLADNCTKVYTILIKVYTCVQLLLVPPWLCQLLGCLCRCN